MCDLSVRQFLQAIGADPSQGVRHLAPNLTDISLRFILQGAHQVHGAIYTKWMSLGGGLGRLGYPISEQQALNPSYPAIQGQRFENGSIIDLGYGTLSSALNDGTSLPEIPYVLTLEGFRCEQKTTRDVFEGGEDELWLRFIVSTSAKLNDAGQVSQVIDYRNDHVISGDDIFVGRVLYSGKLPESMSLACMAIEVDLEYDAEQVMTVFSDKAREHAHLWFSPGSGEVDFFFTFNLIMNAFGTGACTATGPSHPAFWIGGLAGTGLEIVLKLARDWYKSELIGAFLNAQLGADLEKANLGTLPAGTGDKPIEQELRRSSATDKIIVFMDVSFSRYDNGDIREDRRFSGADPKVDYTFTLRHFIGNRDGPKPNPPFGLSVESNPFYISDDDDGRQTFVGVDNHIFWMVSSLGDTGYEVERLTKQDTDFVKIASVVAHNPSTEGANYMDLHEASSEPGDEIKYRVRAYNPNGYGPYSDILFVLIPDYY